LKLAPAVHGVRLDDRRTISLLEVAKEVGHPVYLHCLTRAGFQVKDVVRLAKRFPEVALILGHAGVGNLDLHAIGLIEPYSNIVLETSGGYTIVVRTAIRRLGSRRVLFGTEYPLQHPRVELEKFRALGLPQSIWREVAWANICRLLREDQ
jgi:predicted TIM-barrel fold metal-dependent hydrolase